MTLSSASIGANWFLDGVSNLQRTQLKTQREISSGFRIQDAADSPSQIQELVGLNSALAVNKTYELNLNRVQAEVNAADTAISTAVKLIDTARTLAQQGAGTLATSSDRINLAVQVQSIQEQFVSLANTTTEGRFIFGGGQDLSAPYRYNPASSSGVDKLTTPTSPRVITDPSGVPLFQAIPASTLFDHSDSAGAALSDNAFAGLQTLVTALQSNDAAGSASALSSLESVSSWLNQQVASYGVSGARLSSEQTDAATQTTALTAGISRIRDTDIVQAATDLSQETTAQSAAFAAQAQIPRKSLFDYLG